MTIEGTQGQQAPVDAIHEEKMAANVNTTPAKAPEVVRSEEEILSELQTAVSAKDFAKVKALSTELAKQQKAVEDVAKEQAKARIGDITAKVKAELDKTAAKLLKYLPEADVAVMSGIWYVNDFGESLTSCRVTKTAPKSTGGSGGGKSFAISTNDLLSEFGDVVMVAETGQTYRQAHEASTDGNSRYKVRTKLLKLKGLA